MEPKYYTPEIEEYHVGFEYYWRNSDGYTQDELIPNTIKNVEQIIDIQNPIYEIKVKALDREDIESLGWVLDSCVEGECFYEHKSSNMTSQYDWGLIMREKEETVEIYDRNKRPDSLPLGFYGIIRNKSELKMIMRMVGIAK